MPFSIDIVESTFCEAIIDVADQVKTIKYQRLGKSFRFEKKDKKEEDELEVIMFEKNRQSNDFEKLVEMLESCCKKHKDRL